MLALFIIVSLTNSSVLFVLFFNSLCLQRFFNSFCRQRTTRHAGEFLVDTGGNGYGFFARLWYGYGYGTCWWISSEMGMGFRWILFLVVLVDLWWRWDGNFCEFLVDFVKWVWDHRGCRTATDSQPRGWRPPCPYSFFQSASHGGDKGENPPLGQTTISIRLPNPSKKKTQPTPIKTQTLSKLLRLALTQTILSLEVAGAGVSPPPTSRPRAPLCFGLSLSLSRLIAEPREKGDGSLSRSLLSLIVVLKGGGRGVEETLMC
jgi:hypothetical protein